MKLRSKLLWAQAPLIGALVVIGVAGGFFLTILGDSSEEILKDNYGSVIAMQRMKESIERLDSSALFVVAGRPDLAAELAAIHRPRFDEDLEFQEGNLTEPGEAEVTHRLRRGWNDYLQKFDHFATQSTPAAAREEYFEQLLPAFQEVKGAADAILAMNQDAIVRKSDHAKSTAERSVLLLVVVTIAGLAVALYGSTAITSRLVRPLSVLAQATRRIGAGDLVARARVDGKDEIADLAADFNVMAERLQKYRDSSTGQLLEAQRASQAAIDSLPDPVLVLSIDGKILHANRAAKTWLKVDVDSGLAELEPTLRAVVDRVGQYVAGGKGGYVPRGLDEAVRAMTTDGERQLLPRATPVYAEGGAVVGTALILQDVSRLIRFEELRNDLVATVAHELRTPLTSLRMAIHLLTEQEIGPLTEKQADLIYAAREDCDRLQATVDELLDLSRIQAGRIELRTKPVEVERLVRDALDAQRAFAAEHRVELRNQVLPGVGYVRADVDRIQLVFANLLSNAIRHSPAGSSVKVRASATADAVRFEVTDTGPGIPAMYQQSVFEKYFQMPEAPSGGAGLGLFIAREIVQAHGGELGLVSEPGKGSTFWFKLAKSSPAERFAT